MSADNTKMILYFCLTTLMSLINVQSAITVQGDKLSKKNKRTGRKSSSISVQVSFFQKMYKFELDGDRFCSEVRFDRHVEKENWESIFDNFVGFL